MITHKNNMNLIYYTLSQKQYYEMLDCGSFKTKEELDRAYNLYFKCDWQLGSLSALGCCTRIALELEILLCEYQEYVLKEQKPKIIVRTLHQEIPRLLTLLRNHYRLCCDGLFAPEKLQTEIFKLFNIYSDKYYTRLYPKKTNFK